jgi:ABC-2 type transport system permease protein
MTTHRTNAATELTIHDGRPPHLLAQSIRSESVRVRRPGLLAIGFGLGAAFAVVTTLVTFLTAEPLDTAADSAAPTSFASVEAIEAIGGFFSSFELLGRVLGLVVLAVWALSLAADFDSGFVRMLVQAQPDRRRLFAGKVIALVAFTSAVTLVAIFFTLMTAFPVAPPADLSTDAWSTDLVSEILAGLANLLLSSIVWGAIGLAIATITRSAGAAIGIGVGWLLLVEPLIGLASDALADYLPGGVVGAVTTGGSDTVEWSVAVVIAAVYAAVSLGVAGTVFARRDITD